MFLKKEGIEPIQQWVRNTTEYSPAPNYRTTPENPTTNTVFVTEIFRQSEGGVSRQYLAFLRYALIGGFATAVHFAVLVSLVEWSDANPVLAATVGAACGALISYAGNRRFTFDGRTCHRQSMHRFLLVTVFGTALNGAIVWFGTEAMAWNYLVAQASATIPVLLVTYHLNSEWSFT